MMNKPAAHHTLTMPRLCVRVAALGVTLCCLLMSLNTKAYAGVVLCVPGLPCITPLTPNDPTNPADGPNAPTAPNAGITSGAACDADFMNQIYSRAWLESQRDTIKASILIRKPDSVLEYTCFDQLANLAVSRAGPLFSQSMRWMPRIVPITSIAPITGVVGIPGFINITPIPGVVVTTAMDPLGFQLSMQSLVLGSLLSYNLANFSHTFLGGSSAADYLMTGAITGNYVCPSMGSVYYLAKCRDILSDDRFSTFSELILLDPRLLPAPCTGTTQISQQRIDLAENRDFRYVSFDRTPGHTNLLTHGAPCAPPIPTGLMITSKTWNVDAVGNVTITSTDTYEDKVCPNPGCFYDRGTACNP